MRCFSKAILICLATVFGCTKEHVVEVDTTFDTQWTPTFKITGNNYHRIQFVLDPPPRKTLYRNIVDYSIEYRSLNLASYSVFRRFLMNERPIPDLRLFFLGQANLPEDSLYIFRLVATHRDSTRRISADTVVRIPIIRGRIIRSVRLFPNFFVQAFGFANGFLYALSNNSLFKVDVSTESFVSLSDSVWPDDRSLSYYRTLALYGQTVFIVEPTRIPGAANIVKVFDVSPFRLRTSFTIQAPQGATLFDLCVDGDALYALWIQGRVLDQQITKHDAVNGRTLQTYPAVSRTSGIFDGLFSDGVNLWATYWWLLDNRFVRIDPSTMTTIEEHRNPIYSTSKNAAWDGPDIWIWDLEHSTFSKVHPEGL